MSRLSAACFAFSVMFSFLVAGRAGAQAGPVNPASLEITVRLYDHARVPPDYLRRAKRGAARILREAGVETLWVACPLSAEQIGKYPACGRPWGPADLVVRVLPDSMVPDWARGTTVFGYAVRPRGAGLGVVANVFFHCAQELRREARSLPSGQFFSPGLILGHLMAHEVGHLLLDADGHSRQGIMQASMGRDQLRAMLKGHLLFTRKQARKIRRKLRRRLEAAKRTETAEVQ